MFSEEHHSVEINKINFLIRKKTQYQHTISGGGILLAVIPILTVDTT